MSVIWTPHGIVEIDDHGGVTQEVQATQESKGQALSQTEKLAEQRAAREAAAVSLEKAALAHEASREQAREYAVHYGHHNPVDAVARPERHLAAPGNDLQRGLDAPHGVGQTQLVLQKSTTEMSRLSAADLARLGEQLKAAFSRTPPMPADAVDPTSLMDPQELLGRNRFRVGKITPSRRGSRR